MEPPLSMTPEEYRGFIDESIGRASQGSKNNGGYIFSVKTDEDMYTFGLEHVSYGRLSVDFLDEDGIIEPYYYKVGG